MKKLIAVLALAALVVSMFGACSAGTASGGDKVVNIMTWEDYIPQSVLDGFTAKTGIKVNFSTFESNEEMLTKLQATGAKDYDIILASDYIIDIARKENLIKELDTSKIANWSNINPVYQSQYYDPDNKYTVPYAAGTPLIVYDKEKVGFEITGYSDLWDSRLKDSVVVMDDARNIIGITLKTLGQSFNTTDASVLADAKAKLLELKPNIRALDYNTPQNVLLSGEASVAYMFTPQVVQALQQNPDLTVCYPKEGMGFGIDSIFVPANCPNESSAYEFINYILDGKVGAEISEYELYLCCNKASEEYLSEDFKSNPSLHIPDDVLGDTEFIQDVGDATQTYTDIWTEFKQS